MEILFANSQYKISDEVQEKTLALVSMYAEALKKDLPFQNDFDIIIYPNHRYGEDLGGVDGFAMAGGLLILRLDLRDSVFPLKDVLGEKLKGVIFHEGNHVFRWQTVGYGETLLEATVSEGLAVVYEKENTSNIDMPFADTSNISDLLNYYKERDRDLDAIYNHSQWFYDVVPDQPKYLGYRVGTYIVEEALKNNGQLDISSLTSLPYEQILELSRVEL